MNVASTSASRRSQVWLIVALILATVMMGLFAMCGAGLGLLAWVAARRQAALDETIVFQQDVQYGVGGGQPLHMDIARPKAGNGPFPAIVCIHGGGWRGGDKRMFRSLIQNLAQQGYVAATVQYRFAPAHRFPAQLEDVKCAVRYLRANANELKVDPDRIGAIGGSAGGHLSLLLGVTDGDDGFEGEGGHAEHSSRVQAVGNVVGPADLTRSFPKPVEVMLKDLTGAARDQDAEAYRRASPVTYQTADDPPVFAVFGTTDELVPYEQAAALEDACKQAQVELEIITIQGGGHGSGGKIEDWTAANAKLVKFFDKHLKER